MQPWLFYVFLECVYIFSRRPTSNLSGGPSFIVECQLSSARLYLQPSFGIFFPKLTTWLLRAKLSEPTAPKPTFDCGLQDRVCASTTADLSRGASAIQSCAAELISTTYGHWLNRPFSGLSPHIHSVGAELCSSVKLKWKPFRRHLALSSKLCSLLCCHTAVVATGCAAKKARRHIKVVFRRQRKSSRCD